ncbi:hypothetical protein D3C84_695010 [compost metagenome]
MHALAGQRIEVDRQGRHQGLAFPGAHLGDLALVQGHAADQLDVEVAHAHDALARFTRNGEGFRQQLIEGFTLCQARLELFGLGTQLVVGQGHHLLFERVDRLDSLGHALHFAFVLASKEFLQQWRKHIERIFHILGWRAAWSRPRSRHGCLRRGHSTRIRCRGKRGHVPGSARIRRQPRVPNPLQSFGSESAECPDRSRPGVWQRAAFC